MQYYIYSFCISVADVSTQVYWRTPFHAIGSVKHLTEYTVMDTNHISDSERVTFKGQGSLSQKVNIIVVFKVLNVDYTLYMQII